MAGLGGVLGSVNGAVDNTRAPAQLGLVWLAAVVLFGIRRPGGAILAGIVTVVFPQILVSGLQFPGFLSFLNWGGTSRMRPIFRRSSSALEPYSSALNPDGILAYNTRMTRRARDRRRARRQDGAGHRRPSARAALQRRRQQVSGAVAATRTRVGSVRRGSTVSGARRSEEPSGKAPGAALTLHNVHAGYDGVEVLHGVDLTLPRGAIMALWAQTARVKSTLCRAVSGLLRPTAGRVELLDEDISRSSAHRIARTHGLHPRA